MTFKFELAILNCVKQGLMKSPRLGGTLDFDTCFRARFERLTVRQPHLVVLRKDS